MAHRHSDSTAKLPPASHRTANRLRRRISNGSSARQTGRRSVSRFDQSRRRQSLSTPRVSVALVYTFRLYCNDCPLYRQQSPGSSMANISVSTLLVEHYMFPCKQSCGENQSGDEVLKYTLCVAISRHHLSYDDCLEHKRRKIIRELFCAVLCMTVVHSDIYTHLSSSIVMVALCNRADHYIFAL